MLRTTPPWDFVEVHWIDSANSGGWVTGKDLPCAVKMTTRGWQVKEWDDAITVAGTFYDDDGTWTYGEFITVPTSCIITKVRLDYAEGKVSGSAGRAVKRKSRNRPR